MFEVSIMAWFALAAGAGVVANSKGRSGFCYFLLGLFVPVVGLLIAIGIAPLDASARTNRSGFLVCHACNRASSSDLSACKYCGTSRASPEKMKKGPACAESILMEAKKCKHCGEALDAAA
jgi:hypothetical protein